MDRPADQKPAQGPKWQQEMAQILHEVNQSNTPILGGKKTVYFVRHAQSRSNVAKAKMESRNFLESAEGAASLLRVGFNAPLSDEGRRQLLSVRPHAQSLCGDLEAVFFSPLQRAHDTALALFGDGDASMDGGLRPPAGKVWRSARVLKEQRPKEHAQRLLPFCAPNIMDIRVQGLLQFLAALPFQRFALVGHSIFFRTVLREMGVETYLSNAHIYQAEICISPERGDLTCSSYQLVAAPRTPGVEAGEETPVDNEVMTDPEN
uniref:Uncharacterized protein n=2 Tax=Alexandrium monilatum TaxID=311494 RepID=A0A7S4Q513_9DINO|mmetsp:Transcript_53276/g.158900  ORF Transcript_53276/g.158900 Transcript_53276/m.158900 type:complete len:263 (+) Transcript_53276:92-880(+)